MSTITMSSVPPLLVPRMPLPIICVYSRVLRTGLPTKTQSMFGASKPAVRTP